MKLNKRVITLLIIFLISICIYANFVTGYFSCDSGKIYNMGYRDYSIQYSLYDGRIFMVLILNIAEMLNISLKTFYIILLVISLFISSISVLMIYETIMNLKKGKSKFIKIFLFFICYSYIFNFMYINNMEFIECIIMAMSILLFIIAAKKIVLQDKKILGLIICTLGILFYQGTINIFITTAVLFLFLKEEKNYKKIMNKMILIALVSATVIIFDFVIVKSIQCHVESIQSNRIGFDIIINTKFLINNIIILIKDSLNLFPQFLQMIVTDIIIVTMYIYSIKNKKIKEFWILILLISVCYLSCLIMGIFTDVLLKENGRMFNSVGALLSVVAIYLYIKTEIFETKIFGKIIKAIFIVYISVNLLNTLYVTKGMKERNEKDRQTSLKIKRAIGEKDINKMAIIYITKEEKKHKLIDGKQLPYAYNHTTYGLYNNTNKMLEIEPFDKKIRKQYFEMEIKEKKEKILIIEDSIYITTEVE